MIQETTEIGTQGNGNQHLSIEVLKVLLVDHTMSKAERKRTGNADASVNIMWGTNDYEHLGKGYECHSQIMPELVTEERANVVMPRVMKSKLSQTERSKEMAEVFTPSWICNAQNNLIDNAWFGRENVFNQEITNEDGTHFWIPTAEKIAFADEKGKTWKDYVRDVRLEITCGEAPYLVSRYDATTGEILPIEKRIGMLDRKLRIVSENTESSEDWLNYAQVAYQSTYGYEWQGDNLLLARENLLYTFIDYYTAKFGHAPMLRSMKYIAYIISWNLWQMDGLKMVVPDSCDNVYTAGDLFNPEPKKIECQACKRGDTHGHIGAKCLIRDWRVKDKEKQKIPFVSLLK